MYRLFLLVFFVVSLSVSALDKGKNHKENPSEAYVEAMVTVGSNNCGYLLRLSNGQLIKPTNLPKKYQHFDTKVLVAYDEVKELSDSPCDAQKEVHIAAIKTFKANHKSQGKF